MRWIKHMTASRQDEKVARLMSEYGPYGYGLWWMVLEVVAARIEGNSHPAVTYPVSTWSHLLSLRGSHVRQAIAKLAVTHLVTAEWSGNELTVTIPNLLKYRDEYSKKSRHSPDDVRRKEQIQKQSTEADTHTEITTPKPPTPRAKRAPGELNPQQSMWFSEFWSAYWRRIGRGAAEDKFAAKVKTKEQFDRVMQAIALQAPWMAQRDSDKRPYPATWLNQKRWEDDPDVQQTLDQRTRDELSRNQILIAGLERRGFN